MIDGCCQTCVGVGYARVGVGYAPVGGCVGIGCGLSSDLIDLIDLIDLVDLHSDLIDSSNGRQGLAHGGLQPRHFVRGTNREFEGCHLAVNLLTRKQGR